MVFSDLMARVVNLDRENANVLVTSSALNIKELGIFECGPSLEGFLKQAESVKYLGKICVDGIRFFFRIVHLHLDC